MVEEGFEPGSHPLLTADIYKLEQSLLIEHHMFLLCPTGPPRALPPSPPPPRGLLYGGREAHWGRWDGGLGFVPSPLSPLPPLPLPLYTHTHTHACERNLRKILDQSDGMSAAVKGIHVCVWEWERETGRDREREADCSRMSAAVGNLVWEGL